MIHLIQSRELFGPSERQAELLTCWRKTDEQGLFDASTHPEGRPTVSEMLAMFHQDAINVLGNSDMYYDADFVRQVTAYYSRAGTEFVAMALSRYDIAVDGTATHWNHCDSMDTWITKGVPQGIDVPWPLGTPGIDNRLAWALQQAGYVVINPSFTIRTFHLHQCDYRSYLVDESGNGRGGHKMFRIPPPYAMVHPCEL